MTDAVFREVEVRTWPECSDVVVIDIGAAFVLAHYLLAAEDDPFPGSGSLYEATASYDDRSEQAIRALEADQAYLRSYFEIDDADSEVHLRISQDGRDRLKLLLAESGLSLTDTDFDHLPETERKLSQMPLETLYELMCDWHDVVERHYPAGSSKADPESWVHRAKPGGCHHFHYLAAGVSDISPSDDPHEGEAYELFKQLIDVGIEDYSFGFFVRRAYFHRAEFPGHDSFPSRALAEAGIRS